MKYEGNILAVAETGQSSLRSVMELMAMGLEQGAKVTVRVEGPDEEKVCRRLVELFETHFDFPPRDEADDAQTSCFQ